MGLNNFNGIYSATDTEVTVFKKVPNADVKYNPFFAYKQWISYSGSATNLALPLTAIYSKSLTSNGLPQLQLVNPSSNPTIGTIRTSIPVSGTAVPYDNTRNIDGSLRTITYYSINNLIYKRNNEPYNTIGVTNPSYTKKILYQSASILSFPYVVVGEGIKPESFTFDVPNTMSLKSDKYGNIYDTAIDTSSFISDVMFYEGFNECFDSTRNKHLYRNITFIPGVPTTTGITQSIGLAANFSGTASFISTTTDINGFYDRQHDYAVSFWISASINDTSNRLLIGKVFNATNQQYPFKIELKNGKVNYLAAANGVLKTSISSSTIVSDWTHVVCQKTGSIMQLYINNVLESSSLCKAFIIPSSSAISVGQINNSFPLRIGGFGGTLNSFVGGLDEIRIYNKALSSDNITSLYNRNQDTGTFLQTNVVGNIFHKHGLAVISSPHYKYNNVLNLNYTTTHKSTKRLYEMNVITRVRADEFNMSMNPSMLTDNNTTYAPFVTSSAFSPYITTIGLYDDAGRLLAIGKLGQAIKKRNDVDTNFVIRIDLDSPISWKS